MEQKEKIQLAKQLVENNQLFTFLQQILLEETNLSSDLIISKSNEELGEWVRSKAIAKQQITDRIAKIKQLAQLEKATNPTPTAPK